MSVKRLSIGQLQIYFDESGTALFSDAAKRSRAGVQAALSEYRDFIDRWLDASEEKRPRRITDEERNLRAKLKRSVRDLQRHRFDAEFIKICLQACAKGIEKQSSMLTPTQIAESIEYAASTL